MTIEGAVCLASVLYLLVLALGISEAVFLYHYSEYKFETCAPVWGWIVAACVFDILVALIGWVALIIEKSKNSICLQIGSLTINIWSMVTYYNIKPSCQDFWETSAPELWTFVMIHYCFMWFNIGLICIIIIL
jgi:hypothetical protein